MYVMGHLFEFYHRNAIIIPNRLIQYWSVLYECNKLMDVSIVGNTVHFAGNTRRGDA
jgi:hypothetical protein